MRRFDLEQEVIPALVKAAFMLWAVSTAVYAIDWLFYGVVALMFLAFIAEIVLSHKVGKSKGMDYAFSLGESVSVSLDMLVICLVGIILAYAAGSRMIYVWLLMTAFWFIERFLFKKERSKIETPAAQE